MGAKIDIAELDIMYTYLHTWWQERVDWNNVGIGTLQQEIFGNRDIIG